MNLSVIIPVYNAEKYLSRCLESVFNQDMKSEEYEVIVINDGSTDSSAEIISEFEDKYSNLIHIKQQNQGVSAARNAGLDIAKGHCITFIDSDDSIYPNTLATVLEKLYVEKLDVFYPRIETYDEEGVCMETIPFPGEAAQIKKGIQHGRRTFPPTFYCRALVDKIRFNKDIALGEDTVFNIKAQAFAERVSYSEIPYYKYTVRENSLSKQAKSDKAFEGFLKAIEEIQIFQRQYFENNEEAKTYFDKAYSIFVERMIDFNILPNLNRIKYQRMVGFLKDKKLLYILKQFSGKYPYISDSFNKFSYYQKYLNFKSKIYKLIYRA